MNPDRARLDYLRWLSSFDPALYRRAVKGQAGLAGLGWLDTVLNAIVTVGGAVMQKKQTDKAAKLEGQRIEAERLAGEAARRDQLRLALLDINTQRAQAGLPPVDENGRVIPQTQLPSVPAALAPYYGPAATAQANAVSSPFAGIDRNVLLIGGGVALLGVLFLVRR